MMLEENLIDKSYTNTWEEGSFRERAYNSAQASAMLVRGLRAIPVWRKVRDGRFYKQPVIDEFDNGDMVLCYRDYQVSLIDVIRYLPYDVDE